MVIPSKPLIRISLYGRFQPRSSLASKTAKHTANFETRRVRKQTERDQKTEGYDRVIVIFTDNMPRWFTPKDPIDNWRSAITISRRVPLPGINNGERFQRVISNPYASLSGAHNMEWRNILCTLLRTSLYLSFKHIKLNLTTDFNLSIAKKILLLEIKRFLQINKTFQIKISLVFQIKIFLS